MALVGVIVGYGVAVTTGPNPIMPSAQPQAPVAAQPAQPQQPQEPTPQNVVAPSAKDHIRGDAKAMISLIEYSDFECPFCQRHHPTMQQALDEYGSKVNWVYRHYPLSFHPNAKPAAHASECVAELKGNDAFWEFSDMVFEKGPDQQMFASYAESIGVDKASFETCMTSNRYSDAIDAQMNEGATSGVRGTPGTIVYNNKTKESRYVSGAQPYANVKAAIDALL